MGGDGSVVARRECEERTKNSLMVEMNESCVRYHYPTLN